MLHININHAGAKHTTTSLIGFLPDSKPLTASGVFAGWPESVSVRETERDGEPEAAEGGETVRRRE